MSLFAPLTQIAAVRVARSSRMPWILAVWAAIFLGWCLFLAAWAAVTAGGIVTSIG